MDDKPGQRVMVQCEAVASDQIQVNVMQKSVVYWTWTNVDIYCKRADAIYKANLLVFHKFQWLLELVLKSSNSRNPCNACLTQPSFGAEMFPPNQRSKAIFRKNAEHYIAYNALHAIYHDTISCNIFKLRCKFV